MNGLSIDQVREILTEAMGYSREDTANEPAR
jgi:hypothetical protein